MTTPRINLPLRCWAPAAAVLLLTACVPRPQFDALATERDQYREQVMRTDSLGAARSQAIRDSLENGLREQRRQVRRIEELTASNLSLNGQLADLRARYEAQVAQNRELVAGSGSEVVSLQQQLAERNAELNQREAELVRAERNMEARARSLSSIDEMRRQQPGNEQGTSPVDPVNDAILLLDKVESEVGQLLLAAADDGYLVTRTGPAEMRLVLSGDLLYGTTDSLATGGQRVLRRLGATLRNYPQLEYAILGHGGEQGGDAAAAYLEGTERSIAVARTLADYGLDAGRMLVGSRGLYGAETVENMADSGAARRTEIIISAGE